MKNLLGIYREHYYISPLDLADSAETNRLHSNIVSLIFFIFGIGDLLVLFLLYHESLREHLSSIMYFGIFTLVSVCAFLTSIKVKNVPRDKAYIFKNIPFYMDFCCGIGVAVYNFYILSQPFNGVMTFFLTVSVTLCAFSISPIIFLLIISAGFIAMIPGIYKNFPITGLMDSILASVIMFCLSLYKRYSEKKFFMLLKRQKKSLEVKTFGNFTILYDGKVIRFSRTKSTELLAYLIYKNGSSAKTKELLSVLYGDYADSARYGASFRNLIVDIKHILGELEIQNFFISEYNNFRINPEAVHCDYYDFLKGERTAVKNFTGEFMSQYSWAEGAAAFLERKALG